MRENLDDFMFSSWKCVLFMWECSQAARLCLTRASNSIWTHKWSTCHWQISNKCQTMFLVQINDPEFCCLFLRGRKKMLFLCECRILLYVHSSSLSRTECVALYFLTVLSLFWSIYFPLCARGFCPWRQQFFLQWPNATLSGTIVPVLQAQYWQWNHSVEK